MTLSIALPSKGRLKEKALSLFEAAGFSLELPKDARGYHGSLRLPSSKAEIELLFLSASEIARELVHGKINAGVTGEDLARETIHNADEYLDFPVKLGFGGADVVIAVPEAWVDVETMADLDDVAAEFRINHGRRLRIATKYWQLTQGYFADHGIAAYRIVESLGATEAAPAAGQADVIVDITSTGSTLKANSLKILKDGVILKSEANLIVSKTISTSPEDQISLDEITKCLENVI